MKTNILSVAVLLVFATSCGTIYEAGQTPDDVYYSPANGVNKKEFEREEEAKDQYERYTTAQEDRFLRLKLSNRYRFNCIDDYSYWYDSRYDFNGNNYNSKFGNYRYNYNCGCNNGFTPGFGYGSSYGYGYGWNYGISNPIAAVISYKYPKFNGSIGAGSNVTAYKNKTYGNVKLGYRNPKTGVYENVNTGNSFGNLVKKVFSTATAIGGGNSTIDSWDRATRTFSNSNPSGGGAAAVPSSSAGGNSGGVKSTGSSTSTGRGGRDN